MPAKYPYREIPTPDLLGVEEGGRIIIEKKKGAFSSTLFLKLFIDEGYEEFVISTMALKLHMGRDEVYLYDFETEKGVKLKLRNFIQMYSRRAGGSHSARRRLMSFFSVNYLKPGRWPGYFEEFTCNCMEFIALSEWGKWTCDFEKLITLSQEA